MSLIGQRVGPFELVERASVPEPGRWWLARRTGGQRKGPDSVLVRVLDPDADDAERSALQRAYDLLRAIEDPRVPEPVAYWEGLGALAVAAVTGAPLSEAVAARSEGLPLSEATVVDLMLEVAETLQRVHHRNRCHGHLDAHQIVLAKDGGVWLFGFGSPDHPPAVGWAPPERTRGEPGTSATDQWSLAALAVGLVTGRAPWFQPGANPSRPDAGPLVAGVDAAWPSLGRLLRRMLDPNPAQRYPSLHPIRQELLGLARKAQGNNERRELATVLSRRASVTEDPPSDGDPDDSEERVEIRGLPEPAPEPVADPPEPVVVAPTVATAPTQATAVTEAPADEPPSEVPPPPKPTVTATVPTRAPIRTHEKLPSEPIPVVRPRLTGEVPFAGLGRDLPKPEERSPVAPFAEVVVEPSSVSEELEVSASVELEVEISVEAPTPAPVARVGRPAPAEAPPPAPPVSTPALPTPATLPPVGERDVLPPAFDEDLVTSPTVVPPTESSEEAHVTPPPANDAASQHDDWFAQAHVAPAAAPTLTRDPSLGLSGLDVSVRLEPALVGDDPPSTPAEPAPRANPLDDVPITRIAPVLVGVLAVVLGVWGLSQLF